MSLLGAGITGSLPGADREIRIAVLPVDPATRNEADLLTVALSGARVTVVERTELDRVLREQALSVTQRPDYLKIGRLLRADGMFLLQATGSGTTRVLDLRLVAVQTAAVLGVARYPLPLKGVTDWGKLVANRFTGLFSKLAVTRAEALPISVLNLRSAVSLAGSLEVERELTTLLIHRLSNEREIFVLERRQLVSLQAEKEMSGDEETAFWNGSYLVDGVIDKNGLSPDTLTLHVRLRPPGQGAPKDIEIAAPRRQPAAAIEQVARKILEALKHTPAVSAWEPTREAGQYLDEARWAWRWGMGPEARMAADSAWFLGLQTLPVATLRVNSHQPEAETLEFHVRQPGENSFLTTIFYDPIRQTGWTTNEPPEQAMVHARVMLENYLEMCQKGGSEWKTDSGWLALGFGALETASELLRHCHNYATWKTDFAPDLAPLRELVRKVDALLPAGAKREGNKMSRSSLLMLEDSSKAPASLLQLRAVYGALWQDDPEMGVAMYRGMIRSNAYWLGQRERLAMREWRNPMLAAWTLGERERAPRVWLDFLAEQCAGTSRAAQAEGWLLRLADARHDPQIAEAIENIRRLTMDEARQNYLTEFDFDYVRTLDLLVKKKCAAPKTNRKAVMLADFQAARFAFVKHFVRTVPVHDIDQFNPICKDYPYTREQAREIMPMLAEYESRFTRPDWVETTRKMVAAKAAFSTEELRDFLKHATVHDPKLYAERFDRFGIGGTRAYTREAAEVLASALAEYKTRLNLRYEVMGLENELNWVLNPKPLPARPLVNTTARTTGVLEADHTWAVNAGNPELAGMTRMTANVVRPSRGKALVGVSYQDPEVRQNASLTESGFNALLEVDLSTMQERVLQKGIPGAGFGAKLIIDADDTHAFMIHSPRRVRRLDLKSGEVRDYDVPFQMQAGSSIQVLRGRVFITSPETIVELEPGTGQLNILASSRRRPAANQLDQRSGWGVAPFMFFRKDGALGTVFLERLKADAFGWDQQKKDWLPAFSMPVIYSTRIDHDGRQFVHRYLSYQYYAETWDGVVAPAPLLQNASRENLIPKWLFPMEVQISGASDTATPPVYDGTNLFAFFTVSETTLTSANTSMIRNAGDRDLTMWHFDDRWEVPNTIPIKFKEARSTRTGPRGPAGLERWDVQSFPAGMIFFKRSPFDGNFGSLWYLSYAEIAKWEETLPKSEKRLPRRSAELLRRYDADGNGTLGESEMKTMRSDPGLDDDSWQFHAGRVVETYDQNGDGKLDLAELGTVLGSRGRPGLGLTWVSESASAIMTRLDGDGDQKLTPAEFLGVFRPNNRFLGTGLTRPSVVDPVTVSGNVTKSSVALLTNIFSLYLTNTWQLSKSGMKNSRADGTNFIDHFLIEQGDREAFATTLQQLNLRNGGPIKRVDAIPPNLGLSNVFSFFEPQAEGPGHWDQFSVTTNNVRYDLWVYLFDKGSESLFYLHVKSARGPASAAGK